MRTLLGTTGCRARYDASNPSMHEDQVLKCLCFTFMPGAAAGFGSAG